MCSIKFGNISRTQKIQCIIKPNSPSTLSSLTASTPTNSLLQYSLSSLTLALEPSSSSSSHPPAGKYITAFICTLSGAAAFVEQLAYRKVTKKQTMKEILNVIFYESMVTSCVLGLEAEAEGFEIGTAAYVAVAVAWQVFGVGMVSLILRVSCLFGNVVGAMGAPVVPVLAVMVFKDGMSCPKVVALLLALWGSLSFVYQQYLDHDVAHNSNLDRGSGTDQKLRITSKYFLTDDIIVGFTYYTQIQNKEEMVFGESDSS